MDRTEDNIAETRRLTPQSARGEAGRFYLLVLEGGSSSLFHLPWTGEVVIGRGSETQLRLQDASVSRRHAKMMIADGRARVADLESSNGTSVNGERLEGVADLRSGDVIAVGDVTLVFHAGAGARTAPRKALLDQAAMVGRMDEEIERALRYQRPLTLLCVTLGRAESDAAALAEVLGAHLRLLDIASLSAEGQLLVLMPELGVAAATASAQDLVKALQPSAARLKAGFATCPDDGCDADTLLSAARAAAAAAPTAGVAAATESVLRLDLDGRSIVIADPAMARLFELIRRLAASPLPVLINGETGVGKENAAFAVHFYSPRATRPFVAINCAAIHESLVENELFGHEKGAFTGAQGAKAGLLESASGGTVFLDEVGELSASVQAKLLRVLEAKRITRVGDVREREVDIRIVAATNRDLEKEVKVGRFRQDLFFRLSAANIILPPLRERPREIPILARTFLDGACARGGRAPMAIAVAAMHRLATYAWPGNVRELRNVMEYVAATVSEDVIEVRHLPERVQGARPSAPPSAVREPAPPPATPPGAVSAAPATAADEPPRVTKDLSRFRALAEELQEIERTRMIEALAAAGGVRKRAAELLDMPLRTFSMKLKQYGIG